MSETTSPQNQLSKIEDSGLKIAGATRIRTPFLPVDGKGWSLFLAQALPLVIAGIDTVHDPKGWVKLALSALYAGLINTVSYHSPSPFAPPSSADSSAPAPILVTVAPKAFSPAPPAAPLSNSQATNVTPISQP
jgi:hypothetical protein